MVTSLPLQTRSRTQPCGRVGQACVCTLWYRSASPHPNAAGPRSTAATRNDSGRTFRCRWTGVVVQRPSARHAAAPVALVVPVAAAVLVLVAGPRWGPRIYMMHGRESSNRTPAHRQPLSHQAIVSLVSQREQTGTAQQSTS